MIPSTGPDLATITILVLTTSQDQAQTLLFTVVIATLLLSSYARTLATEREQLTLISYGIMKRSLILTHYLRGMLLSTIGILPLELIRTVLNTGHLPSLMTPPLTPFSGAIILMGAAFYTIPFVLRLETRQFRGQLKS